MQTATRNILLDILKVIAATLVISTHCRVLLDYNQFAYHITNNHFFRITIPFFFCINGFYLYTVFQKKNIRVWIKRVGILYIIWMLIFSYFWITPVLEQPLKIISTFFFGFTHLWYLAALFLGGLLLYVFRKYSNTFLLTSAFILYFIGFTIQTLSNYNTITEPLLLVKLINYSPIYRNFLFFGFPFLSIGYVIHRSKFHLKIKKSVVLLLLICSFLLLLLEGFLSYNIYTEGTFNMSASFLFIGPILLITAFTFTVKSNINSKKLSNFAIALYLVHPLILVLIYHFFTLDSALLTVITVLLSGIASYLLIILNKKVTYIL